MRIGLRFLGGAAIVVLSFWITLTLLHNWTGSFEDNTVRPGGEYRELQLAAGALPAACQAECEKDAQCVAWSYVRPVANRPNPVCLLKGATAGNPRHDECCVSGVARPMR
jgi:hypothetical protein